MVFEKVREIICDQLDVAEDDVTMESNIADDLGADSLDVVDLVMSLEEEFDAEFPDEDIESMSNQIMDMMGDEDGFEPGGAMPFPMMNMFGGPLQQEEENLPAEPEEPASDEPGGGINK